jgi:membrane-associated HD superfamily phosphohydrolase
MKRAAIRGVQPNLDNILEDLTRYSYKESWGQTILTVFLFVAFIIMIVVSTKMRPEDPEKGKAYDSMIANVITGISVIFAIASIIAMPWSIAGTIKNSVAQGIQAMLLI